MLRCYQIFLIASMSFVTGCANLQSINHEFGASTGGDAKVKAVSVDAQQRFLLMSYDNIPGPAAAWRLCAEPSPDALAAFSSSLAASGNYKDTVAAQFAGAISEQAASIGLRTQSITLLRDSAYRLCEGYLNGALDQRQFETLHRRFQNIMVANLAIEQLTGYAKPTVVALGGTASANAGAGLAQAQAALDDAVKQEKDKEDAAQKLHDTSDKAAADSKTKQTAADDAKKNLDSKQASLSKAAKDAKGVADKAQADYKAKQAAADAAKENGAADAAALAKAAANAKDLADKTQTEYKKKQAAADQLTKTADTTAKDAKTAKDTADKAAAAAKDADTAVEDAKKNVKALTDARDAARSLTASAASTNPVISTPPATPVSTAEIAKQIEQIVFDVVARDYTKDNCLDFLTGKNAASTGYEEIKATCLEVVKAYKTYVTGKTGENAPEGRQPRANPFTY